MRGRTTGIPGPPAATGAIALLLLLVAACAVPPVEHVRLYAETAEQTRAAGNLVLDRIAPIQAAAPADPAAATAPDEVADCGPDGTGIPRCFDPRATAGAARSEPPAVAVQRLALDLVAAYAALLADLAEGKSAAELRAQIGVVAEIARAALALTGVGLPAAAALPALLPPLEALAVRFETARAGLVVRQALVADRALLDAVLTALIDQTPRMYEVYRAKRRDDLRAAATARDRAEVDAVLDDLRRFHAALAAYVGLLRASASALDSLARASAASARPTPQVVQGALRLAIDARADAQSLFKTVRLLDNASK